MSAPSAVPPVRRLVGRPVGADWGDPTLLAGLDALEGSTNGRPLAEVWYGAHPRHPSWVVDDGGRRVAVRLAAHERPAVLVKLLAAGAPLSIQVHPDAGTARRRWDAEEASGVPRDAPDRRSADPFAKPELVRALTPFRALCGFRGAAASRRLLTTIAARGAEPLLELLAHGDSGLGAAVGAMLRADRATVSEVLTAVVTGARAVVAGTVAAGLVDDAVLRLAGLALDLCRRFPDDPGVLVALLLEDVDLAPGDALFVAPGTPHAYLSGLAVEVMAPSDNVARGGMTVKPVDVDAFLEVLDPGAVGAPRSGTLPRHPDGTGWRRHITPSDAFVLDEVDLDGTILAERVGNGPSILLCVDGAVTVAADGGPVVELGPGGAALLDVGLAPVGIRGRGLVLHAGAGRGAGAVTQEQGAPTIG